MEPATLVAALAAIAGLFVAILGAMIGAAILVYSPTKIARIRGADSPTNKDLAEHERTYEVLGWLALVFGIAVGAPLFWQWAAAGGWPLAVLAVLIVGLLCAALPSGVAPHRPERIVLTFLPALRIVRVLLHYPLVLLSVITRGLMRAARIHEDAPRRPEDIADEIMAAVTDSAQESQLEEEERNWIENIVELKDLRVSEVMTPRTDVVAFEADLPLTDAVQQAIEKGHSRYPVYEGKVDHVIGVFYAKDALARLSNGSSKEVAVRQVMRQPLFVPETMGVNTLLREFKTGKVQLAVVLDEYGGTAGLISIEDILEEIVGDITDEFEADEEDAIVTTDDDRVVEVAGRARIDEINKALGCALPENEDYDTAAGYLFTRLGRIPKNGETTNLDGIEFEVLEADDRRIARLRLRLPEPATRE